jgi:hypothetical protein
MEAATTTTAKRKNTIGAAVTRCGCPKKANKRVTHGVDDGGNLLPCPNPRKVTDLGEVSFNWEGHPFKTVAMTVWIWIRRRFINDR